MTILLDLHNTLFIHGSLHPAYPSFRDFVHRTKCAVTLWTSEPDGRAIATLLDYQYLDKNDTVKPFADVLIDDNCDLFQQYCVVQKIVPFVA